ncbi:phosphotransferase [Mycolicibacterium sp. YH-1]|uniref:phosphotransferase n=1 Tax=Mycolicibacterium sp. YH-1 TaxID=2908837 RepID=UPI001F4C109B|nr:phosphotransferase [Mycolicibacterium sp. YH-1]UNB52922.1 phosphotransferase [Mycolicibacterium sp. YH-1]
MTRPMPDMDRLSEALHSALPRTESAAIIHGDYRINNTIVDERQPDSIRAVVDWELSTLGEPLTDIALMCVYRPAPLNAILGFQAAWTSTRLPSADALAQQYAVKSGSDLSGWPFCLALANFKLAVIAEGIAHRARLGAASPNGEAAGAAVPELVAAGLRALARTDGSISSASWSTKFSAVSA